MKDAVGIVRGQKRLSAMTGSTQGTPSIPEIDPKGFNPTEWTVPTRVDAHYRTLMAHANHMKNKD